MARLHEQYRLARPCVAGMADGWAAAGKPRSIAWVFTAAWLLVYFLAVFPYLFATRGVKGGAAASVKLVLLYGVLGIAWIVAGRLM